VILWGVGLVLLGLFAGLAAYLLWQWSRRDRAGLGLPEGRIVRADMGAWRQCEEPLYSARYRLAGRPDYLVKTGRGLVPVEVKPGRTAPAPYTGDVLQLGAYLLLVEEDTGVKPTHGLLRYREQTFEIPYTPGLRQEVIACLEEMRALREASQPPEPQHREPQRCTRCGQREHCDVSLTDF